MMTAVSTVNMANIIAVVVIIMMIVVIFADVINVMIPMVFIAVMVVALSAAISISCLKLGIPTFVIGMAVCGKCQPSDKNEASA